MDLRVYNTTSFVYILYHTYLWYQMYLQTSDLTRTYRLPIFCLTWPHMDPMTYIFPYTACMDYASYMTNTYFSIWNLSTVTSLTPTLSDYLDPDFHSCVSCITPGTTEPIGSPWYMIRLLSQGLTCIFLSYLNDRVIFFTNGDNVLLLISWGIPCLH